MRLILETRLREIPPRLPEQPIFYPVLNAEYASQIASRWNTKSRDYVGYVTKFEVDDKYVSRFEPHIVGGRIHEELWVPAEQLSTFNQHIIPPITVTASYFGEKFRGYVPVRLGFRGRDAVEQFVLLNSIMDDFRLDFSNEILANSTAVFLNFPFWREHDFAEQGIEMLRRDNVLATIGHVWGSRHPDLPLPGTTG